MNANDNIWAKLKSKDRNRTKALVTGAAGQLGTAICQLLMRSRIPFLAIDKNSDGTGGYPIEIFDLLNGEKYNELFDGVSVLIHLANHPTWSTGTPAKVYCENVSMNMSIFQAAAEAGCERIVFASSIQVLNGQKPSRIRLEQEILLPYIPIDSEMPAVPGNNYALSKLAAENMLKYFARAKGMTCISLRYPWLLNIKWLKKAVEEGGIRREHCFDGFAYLPLYSAAELALKAATAELTGYREYFAAAKDTVVQSPASEVIQRELSHLPCKKPLEEMDSLVDCSKVEKELGWRQPRSLREAYQKCGKLENINNYEA